MPGTRSSLAVVGREWTRIGLTGFGGPPAHIALLRSLVVDRYRWMSAEDFESANAACNILPGPASTQLAIYCAYRVAGIPGAVIGGFGFIAPAVILILALSALFLSHSPPRWIRGAGAGAGAAVAAVALHAARQLAGPSSTRARERRQRWILYAVAGAAAGALLGAYLVLILIACGLVELMIRTRPPKAALAAIAPHAHLGGLAWTAFKVGALSFGGGFVIVPLMQGDAVHTYHWMTNTQFLNAVALGQVTPGPVVATVAAVGYAADKIPGGLLAAVIAFAPSFTFILVGGRRFTALKDNPRAQAFLDGSGPAAIGAIAGAAIPLAAALHEWWQVPILAAAALFLGLTQRGVVPTLLAAGAAGAVLGLAGAPLP